MKFSYDLTKLEEPSLLNVLISEFNERGYVIAASSTGFIIHGEQKIAIVVHGTDIHLYSLLSSHSCSTCSIYDPKAFAELLVHVETCLKSKCCLCNSLK